MRNLIIVITVLLLAALLGAVCQGRFATPARTSAITSATPVSLSTPFPSPTTQPTVTPNASVSHPSVAQIVPTTSAIPSTPHSFSFSLPVNAITSAGVFDANGHLVRVLWQLRSDTAGQHTETWDGRDESGQPASEGGYRFKVVWNPGRYDHVAAIGNSGDSSAISGHTPSFIFDVTTDGKGGIYTVNGWDEAGADFKKWDRSGKSVYDARFQIRNGTPYSIPYAVAHDDTYLYCATAGFPTDQSKERQKVRRYRLTDGKEVPFTGANADHGHIKVMDWPSKALPATMTGEESFQRTRPLRALAVIGNVLFVGDALNDRVNRYDKETGEVTGSFPLVLPRAFAVDKSGALWVVHEHHKLSRIPHPLEETPTIQTIRDDLGEVEAISLAPDGSIYVADNGTGQVRIFSPDGKRPIRTFGQHAKPGDYAPDHFYYLRSVAVDSDGTFVTVQTEESTGARIARWTANGQLIWEKIGGEFVSGGNYSTDDPSTLYSFAFHRYHLTIGPPATWEYRGNLLPEPAYKSNAAGSVRILSFHGKTFAFYPLGDGVQVYRLDGDSFHLCALVGGKNPGPDGKSNNALPRPEWSWHDIKGTGVPLSSEIQGFRKLKQWDIYATFGMSVDSQGNIWYCSHGIHEIPLSEWDALGNPVYDWSKDILVVPEDRTSFGFTPNCAHCADDGTIYAFGWTKQYPAPKNNPFWMGGTTLVAFDPNGGRRWFIPLKEVGIGMDTVPGGGLIVGGAASATLYHFSNEGLLLGTVKPGAASSNVICWLDNNASISVNRNPNDKKIDAFVEDDLVGRINWYRIEDQNPGTVSGNIP